jgi:adenylate cyclase class 2
MREIEVKAKLSNIQSAIEILTNRGVSLSEKLVQNDTIYAKELGNVETYLKNKHFLRLRTVNNTKTFFNLKMNGENSLTKIEYETEVSKREEIHNILVALGFQPSTITNKTRITGHYKEMEICIDEVEGLGAFIEVEIMTDEGNAEEIQNKMFDFLRTLGVEEKDRVFEGYDILLLRSK